MKGKLVRRFNRRAFMRGMILTSVSATSLGAACSGGTKNSRGATPPKQGTPAAERPRIPVLPEISLAPELTQISAGTPRRGGVFHAVLGGGIPDQYNPLRDAGYPGLQVAACCLSSLVRAHYPILGDLTILPDLAERWEQPDHLTTVFHLRKGAKWQNVPPVNGRPLTSNDIKLNFDYMRTPQPDFVLGPMFSMVDSVQASDDTTVLVKTAFPYAPLISNLADVWGKIIPQEQYPDDLSKQKPVGSGPFIFDHFTNGVEYVLRRNPDYYIPGRPYVDEIHWHVFDPSNPNLVPSAFKAKQIDVFGSGVVSIAKQTADSVPNANWGWRYNVLNPLMLNNSRPPFNDERVRQAVMYAIDTDTIIKIAWQGFGQPGQQIPLWQKEYRLPDSDLPKRDVQKAKQLLTAAGHPDGIEITDKTFQGAQLAFGTLQVQQSLQEAGIKMNIQQMQWADWRVNVYGYRGDFECTIGGEFDYLSLDRQLWNSYHSKGAANNRHVNDPTLDKLLDDARREFDHNKSVEMYKTISKYITEHAINIALPNGTSAVATQPWVKGWFYDWSAGALLEVNLLDQLWLEPH